MEQVHLDRVQEQVEEEVWEEKEWVEWEEIVQVQVQE
jgi:hypothetical protein